MKSRRKHGFQFMAILYFLIVFCMCVSRFNVIMTIMGGQLTRVEEINLLPFHSIRENLKYGRSPVSWDMLYNIVMFDTELYSEHISHNALSCDDRNYDLNKPRIKDIL